MIASAIMAYVGPTGLFGFTALVHVLLAGFAFYRMSIRDAPEAEQRRDFTETLIDVQTVAPLDSTATGEEK